MTALWLVFGGYLLLLLAAGEWFGRRKAGSLETYLLSGREHGTWVTTAALVATVIGAGSTLGAAGVAYYVGVSAGWYLLSAVPALLLLGLTLAPRFRELSLFSVPEYVQRRYGRRAGLLAAVLGLAGLVLFLAAQFYAMGRLLNRLTELATAWCIVLSGTAVVLYTWRGGNWAVHASDSLQMVWIVIGVGVALVAGLEAAGGWDALSTPPPARGLETAGGTWLHPLRRTPVSGWNPFALGNTVVAWVIMSTTWHFAMQSTAQRILSSRDAATVRRSCLLAALVLVPLSAVFAVLGMEARILFPGLEGSPGREMLEQVQALPALIRGVLAPAGAGLVLAALVAVIMSTCDSALLGAATLVMKDLRPWLEVGDAATASDVGRGSGADEAAARDVARGRRLVLAVGAVGLAGALVAPGLVQVLELVAAVYCVALFVPLLGGHWWGGASEAGALASMAASGLVAVAWRATGLEASTGLHMLNLALPAAVVGLVVGSWSGREG